MIDAERQKKIDAWMDEHCQKCEYNNDREAGPEYLDCQAECEVEKDVGIACIHYEEHMEEEDGF